MWQLAPSKITKEWLNPTKTINHNSIKKTKRSIYQLRKSTAFIIANIDGT